MEIVKERMGLRCSAALRRLARGEGSLLVVAVEGVEAGSLSLVRSCWPDGDLLGTSRNLLGTF